MPLRYTASTEWASEAFIDESLDERPERIKQEKETCSFLDIIPFSECETKEQQDIWLQMNTLAHRVSEQCGLTILDLLKNQEYAGRVGVGEPIISYLKEKDLIFPEFKFRFGQEGQKMLESVGLGNRIPEVTENEGILLFQLPKPLAEYWWKATKDQKMNPKLTQQQSANDLNNLVIEWGTIYRKLMPSVWEARDATVEFSSIRLDRINESGEHSPREYYYVWQARKFDGYEDD